MKKNNYFAVHKNKKPKTRLEKTNFKSVYDVISKSKELMETFINFHKCINEFNKSMVFSNPIPKYKKGGISEISLVGDSSLPEIILDKDVPIKSTPFGNYYGGITAKELIEASKILKESFPSVKDLTNIKATN